VVEWLLLDLQTQSQPTQIYLKKSNMVWKAIGPPPTRALSSRGRGASKKLKLAYVCFVQAP
jgi:hypothetical protein